MIRTTITKPINPNESNVSINWANKSTNQPTPLTVSETYFVSDIIHNTDYQVSFKE